MEAIEKWMPKVSVKLNRWCCSMTERMKAPWLSPSLSLARRRSATSLSSSRALLAVATMTSTRIRVPVKTISLSITDQFFSQPAFEPVHLAIIGFVVVSGKVQHPMNYERANLIFKRQSEFLRIPRRGLDRNDDVAVSLAPGLLIRE